MHAKNEIPKSMQFMNLAQRQIELCATNNLEVIAACAKAMAPRLKSGGRFFGFGCGHSGLVSQDAYYRAGGLRGFQHLFAPLVELSQEPVVQSSVEEKRSGWIDSHLSPLEFTENDCLVIVSTSGVNAVPVEAALHAQERKALVIALTSVTASQSLEPRHASGQRLMEIADYVLDNGSPYGDTLVALAGSGQGMGSASTITGCFLLQSLTIAVQEHSLANGSPLPTYVSGNVPGGMEKNLEGY